MGVVEELSRKYPHASEALRKWDDQLRSLKEHAEACNVEELLIGVSKAGAMGVLLACRAGMTEDDMLSIREEEEERLRRVAQTFERGCFGYRA
jgi:hypothetical protein